MKKLSPDFIVELFKICLRDQRVFEVSLRHMRYQFLPSEEHKKVWDSMLKYFEGTNKLITLGLLSQEHTEDTKTSKLIGEIKSAITPDKDSVLEQLEIFIKNRMFLSGYDQLGDLFNLGDKNGAFNLMNEISEDLSGFTIKDDYFDKIYTDFSKRHVERGKQSERDEGGNKIPIGIDAWDRITRGGIDKGDTVLISAQSGIGKTKLLRHIGVHVSRMGGVVAHLQAEGSRDECLDGYDATWLGLNVSTVEVGSLGGQDFKKIEKVRKDILASKGEIYVESYEQFNSASLLDVRSFIQGIEKIDRVPDVVLLDYFELFDPGDGKQYKASEERHRRESLANKLKNIALEFGTRIITCTQASTVDPLKLNNPKFVQTRFDISEFKGVVRPFSHFVTMNQTGDEKDAQIMRLHFDKIRKYRAGQTIKIYQNYEIERFYDRNKTIKNGELA